MQMTVHDERTEHAPAIPTFASLRAPQRRTAVDVLLPGAPVPPVPAPRPAPRPAEYADLWRFGIRTARVAAGIPSRLVGWSVRTPLARLGRLIGR